MLNINRARRAFVSKSTRVPAFLTAAFALFIFMFAAPTANAATLIVTNTLDAGAGSLRDQIAAAVSGDTIEFDPAVFNVQRNIDLTSGTLSISKNLTITGTGARLLTVRRAVGNPTNFGIFTIGNLSSLIINISDITISNGNAGNGGGIYKFGGTLTLNRVAISGNTATNGGGIRHNDGTTTILNSTISGNTAQVGGGILTLNGNGGSVVNIINSTVSGNTCTLNGGGGGIDNQGRIALNNATITNNRAINGGTGGVRNARSFNNFARNSIIAGNFAGSSSSDGNGIFTSNGNNLIGVGGGGFSAAAPLNDRLNAAANLDELRDNGGQTDTHRPLSGSLAIDAGNNCVVAASCGANNNPPAPVTTDQRGAGFPRQMGAAVDIGAFETDRILTVNKTADTNDGVCDSTDCTLRDAISVAGADALPDTIIFNIPANSPNCNSTACTITVTTSLAPAVDAGNLTTIDGGAASRNTITLSGGGTTRILEINNAVKVSVNNLIFTGGINSAIFIRDAGSVLTLTNSALFGNTAADENLSNNGGAINVQGGTLNMTNVTVSGNSAVSTDPSSGGSGGGIANFGTANATNCTITNNTASNFGGGVINAGTFNVRNTIIAGNSAPTLGPDAAAFAVFTSQGNNLIGNGANATGFTNNVNGDQVGTTAAPINPRLSPLGNYGGKTFTHALLDQAIAPNTIVSPAINAGTSTGAPLTDARGAARVGNVDIGAFEVNSTYVARLPNGTELVGYDQTIAPDNGAFIYTVSSGTLPPGLALLPISLRGVSKDATGQSPDNFAPTVARVSIQGAPTTAGTYPFSITLTNAANTTTINYSILVQAPTAAGISISGRVNTPDNFNSTDAQVTLTDAQGNSQTVRTGRKGSYRFTGLTAGETYILSVAAVGYNFAPQAVTALDNLTGVNFTAIE